MKIIKMVLLSIFVLFFGYSLNIVIAEEKPIDKGKYMTDKEREITINYMETTGRIGDLSIPYRSYLIKNKIVDLRNFPKEAYTWEMRGLEPYLIPECIRAGMNSGDKEVQIDAIFLAGLSRDKSLINVLKEFEDNKDPEVRQFIKEAISALE